MATLMTCDADLRRSHDLAVLASLGADTPEPEALPGGGWVTLAEGHIDAAPIERRVATFLVGGACVQSQASVWTNLVEVDPRFFTYLEDGLEPFSPLVFNGADFEEWRLGYRLRLPGGPWTMQERTTRGQGGNDRSIAWQGPQGAGVHVTAADAATPGAEAGIVEMLVHRLEETGVPGFGTLVRGAPVVAGRPAVSLRSTGATYLEVRAVTDRSTAYIVIVTGVAPEQAESLFAGFELLP